MSVWPEACLEIKLLAPETLPPGQVLRQPSGFPHTYSDGSLGGAIVVASTIWVAVQKVEEVPRKLGGVESDVEYGLVPLEENEQEREGDNDDDFLANSVGKAEEEEEANTNREKRGVESSASI